MAIPHAKPGEVIDVRPLGKALANTRTTVLVKTEGLEIIRLVLPRGKEIPTHATHGEITVQCLEGRATCQTGGASHELGTGEMLYLHGEQSHSVKGIDDASILLTITFPRYSPPAERLTHCEQASPSEQSDEPEAAGATELSRGRGGRVDFDSGAATDLVDQASQESFPASDAPGFIYCDATKQPETNESSKHEGRQGDR
jgi:quercetin dioxygenase-like cupin family protein